MIMMYFKVLSPKKKKKKKSKKFEYLQKFLKILDSNLNFIYD